MIRILILFIVITFAPRLSFGQFEPTEAECALITKTISDEYRDITRVISKEEIRVNDLSSGDLFQIVMTRNQETFSFIIRGVDRHCFENDTQISFYFRDGSSLQFDSQNKQNCESLLLVNMGGIYRNDDRYDNFLNQFLVGIMFQSSDGDSHKLKIETPQTEMIQEVFECLIVSE